MKRWLGVLALVWIVPVTGAAQDTTQVRRPDTTAALQPAGPVTLSLADALAQARRNSPTYRQVLNNEAPAKWGVRNAYGNLLPSVSASADMGYTGEGESNFGGGFVRPTSAFLTSAYNLGVFWQLDGRAISAPGQAKALKHATDEDISGAGIALQAEITTQYLTALQTAAQVEVARQQVSRNADFLKLAKARYEVGQATLLDVRQAEVAKGQSDVSLLRATYLSNEAKLDLLRRMGVEPPAPVEAITLSDSFPVQAPQFQLEDLLSLADEQNPSLRSLRARQSAASWGVRAAKSEYLPTLQVSAGWSGFTQEFTNGDILLNEELSRSQALAADCSYNNEVRTALSLGGQVPDCNAAFGLTSDGSALTDPKRGDITSANNVFPFNYTGQPFQANMRLSLPIFTGFGRSLRVSQAREQELDADEAVRGRRLQVRSDVHARYLALQTAYQAIPVQGANREAARDQLRLAQDRYRLGAGTSLEVSDAQNAVQQAEADYVNAVYAYHRSVADLEAAVGRPLR
jgi:outer membrane protein